MIVGVATYLASSAEGHGSAAELSYGFSHWPGSDS